MNGVVVVPTYNERDNIESLIKEIILLPDLDILVVDDNSPDGTGAIVAGLARENPRIHLLTRTKRKGRGSAGVAGFKMALNMRAQWIIEMDADFSHHPRHIPDLLAHIKDYDLVLGSRFMTGGADRDRGIVRHMVTCLAGVYVRALLDLNIRDISSGFRCFRREVFEKVDLDDMISAGPSIVLEILYKVCLSGFRVKEVPIVFRDRRQGETKLDTITLLETLVMVLRLRKLNRQGLLLQKSSQNAN
ncbi:MAG: polyprenol monophosphomannose synthase [Proteobacteria bacterium]|nr:polyprenol monophosphomannose synthase [Pseudomonadota bacterium]MBU4258631.1 polyprenol monophosphomannose synthase [Pseudomonadota bacterium]MBU4286903.1 polyprenol monophosphomannose synthase [Pseudomonadota bacterium]MBU4414264.1 polyprenol monophosphomannose synthase [Pseudomonadota bacterium]MCG2758876.1 polyprenol monophosphomannose synthase [Desulfobacteraceae bacterium]